MAAGDQPLAPGPLSAGKIRWGSFMWERFRPVDLVTSYFVAPAGLFGFRLAFSVILVTGWIYSLATLDLQVYFSWFTTLNYMSVCIYCVLMTVYSGIYVFRCGSKGEPAFLNKQSEIGKKLLYMWALIHPPLLLLISIVYWVLLYPSFASRNSLIETVGDIFIHALQSVFIIGEVMLRRMFPGTVAHVSITLAPVAVFVAYAWIWTALYRRPDGSIYFVYEFMNPQFPNFYLYYIATFVIAALFHFMFMGLSYFRNFLGRKKIARTIAPTEMKEVIADR